MNKRQKISAIYIGIILLLAIAHIWIYFALFDENMDRAKKYSAEIKDFDRDFEDMGKMKNLSKLCDKRYDDLFITGYANGREWDDLADDIDEYIKDYERLHKYKTSFGNTADDNITLELMIMEDDLIDSKEDIDGAIERIEYDGGITEIIFMSIFFFCFTATFLFMRKTHLYHIGRNEQSAEIVVMKPDKPEFDKPKKRIDWGLGKTEDDDDDEYRKLDIKR